MATLLEPAQIQRPQTGRDPGIRSVPATIRDPRAAAASNFARDMQAVAGTFQALADKRRAAEDGAFLDDFQFEFDRRAADIEAKALNSAEIGNPNFVNELDRRLEEEQQRVLTEVQQRRGYTPSADGLQRATSLAQDLRLRTARNATGQAHNQRVSLIVDTANEHIDNLARVVAQTGNLDDGLARADAIAARLDGVLAPSKVRATRDAARATITEMAVRGHLARGEYDEAQAIIDRETGFAKPLAEDAPVLEYPTDAPGLVEIGNIDLNDRPVIRIGDEVATLRSASREIDGVEVLVPTVTHDGRIVSEDEAFEIYARTGEHLGKFASAEAATAYAQKLSDDQGTRYNPQTAGAGAIDTAIINSAKLNGQDPATALAVAWIESALDPLAAADESSARGIFQITGETARDYGLPSDVRTLSLEDQIEGGMQIIAANTNYLRRSLGTEPSPTEIYMAHFFGPGGAVRILQADPGTPLTALISKEAIEANSHLRGMTAAGAFGWARGRMQEALDVVASGSLEGRRIRPDSATLPLSTAVSLSRAVASARSQESNGLKNLLGDDIASIRRTGIPADIDPNRAALLLSPSEFQSWQEDRIDAGVYWDSTNDMDTLTNEEVLDRVSALEPAPGSVGYERQLDLHDDVAAEAQRVLRVRNTDPARSVADVPEVQQAVQAFDSSKPQESWAALMSARLAAQGQIGIPEEVRAVLTTDEARRYAAPIRGATEADWYANFQEMASGFETSFGDYADEALKQIITEFVSNETHAGYAARILTSLLDRQQVMMSDAIAADVEGENARIDGVADQLGNNDEFTRAERAPGLGAASRAASENREAAVRAWLEQGESDPRYIAERNRFFEDSLAGRVPFMMSPSRQAVDYLRANPNTVDQFIEVYGANAVPLDLR